MVNHASMITNIAISPIHIPRANQNGKVIPVAIAMYAARHTGHFGISSRPKPGTAHFNQQSNFAANAGRTAAIGVDADVGAGICVVAEEADEDDAVHDLCVARFVDEPPQHCKLIA